MIPSNTITDTALLGQFLYPENLPYNPLQHKVKGGVLLNDSSKGRDFKTWTATLAQEEISIKADDAATAALTLNAPGALSVSLAFDNNMSPAVAWQTATGTFFYYFDSVSKTNIIRSFLGTTSCKVCVDDVRSFYLADSDIILAYTLNNNLYWRQQRDRYDVERLVAPTTKKLIRLGLTDVNRLQFECSAQAPRATIVTGTGPSGPSGPG